jgi:aminoglycoside phosphotransferase (APT) family kinase protein
LDWLEEHKGEVISQELSVLHRDFHPGNIMIRPDGSYVVIDWGASEPGDFRVDLLWTVLLASAFWDLSMGKIILKAYERASSIEVQDANYFEVVAIYRRIMDAVVAFTVGSEEAGMRSGALDQMRKASAHYQRIHGFLEERTGLRLTEFDQLLKTL